MGFENRKPVHYIKAKDGKLIENLGKSADGKIQTLAHDRLTARVKEIKYAEFPYNGETIKSWQVWLFDNSGDYCLTLGYSSGFTRGFFNALSACNLKNEVTIGCYVKNDFNCPSIAQDYELVKWKYPEMPKTVKVTVGSNTVIDDTECVKWLTGVIKEIQDRLAENRTLEPTEVVEIMNDGVASDLPWEAELTQ